MKKPAASNLMIKSTTCIIMAASLVMMIGIIIISIEMIKFQPKLDKFKLAAGILLIAVGFLTVYVLFGYSILKNRNGINSSGPMLICTNCLSIMIGGTFIIVTHLLPLNVMFAFLAHVTLKTNNGTTFVVTRWPDSPRFSELQNAVWTRITIFGVVMMGLGLVGLSGTSSIMLRSYVKHQESKKNTREEPNPDANQIDTWKSIKFSKRKSMYDYAAWESRSTDLYSEKAKPPHETKVLVSRDGRFNDDVLTEHKLSSDLVYNSPFETVSKISKNAKKLSVALSPVLSFKQQKLLKSPERLELDSVSEICAVKPDPNEVEEKNKLNVIC